MNNREILAVALKFLGIQLGLQSVTPLTRIILIYTRILPKNPRIESIFLDPSTPFMGPVQIFLFIFYVTVSWYVWTHAKQVSAKFIKEEKYVGITKENMLELVILIEGIGSLVYGFPALLIRIFQNGFFSETLGGLSSQMISQFSSLMYLMEVLLGLFFIFKSRRIANWIYTKIPAKFWQ